MAGSSTVQTVTNYLSTLTKERYVRKLQCLHGGPGISMNKLLCPYDIPDVQWVDDVSKQPPVEFGHLYVYFVCFVETPGGYTLEATKAYKSLEAYNYYHRLVPSFYTCTLYKLMLLTQSLVAEYVQCIFMILVMASTVF